jgi:GTP cyclohydrolase I
MSPRLEIFAAKGMKISNVTSTAHDEIVVVNDVPVEEMCPEDMPHIDVDLGDLDA